MLSRLSERQSKLQSSRTRWGSLCRLRMACRCASPRHIYGATEDFRYNQCRRCATTTASIDPDTRRRDRYARGTKRRALLAHLSTDSAVCGSSRSKEREKEAAVCRLTVLTILTFRYFSRSRRIAFSTFSKDSCSLGSLISTAVATIRVACMGPWHAVDSLRRATYCLLAQFDGRKNRPHFRRWLRALFILILTPRSGDIYSIEIGRERLQQTARPRITRAALYSFAANPLRAIRRAKTFYVRDHDVDACFGIVKLSSPPQHPSAAGRQGKQLLTLGFIGQRMTSGGPKQTFKLVLRTRPSAMEARRDLYERSTCFAIPTVQPRLAGSAP